MKKILAVVAILAITMVSTMAFAASEVTVSGSIDIRGRAFNNITDFDSDANAAADNRDTDQRVRVNIDAKAGDAKGKVTIEQDYVGETWGGLETANGQVLRLREAWLDTALFGPVRLKGGHMLLQLGNGWFLRHMKFGDDAWVGYADMEGLHVGLVNAKIAEGANDYDQDFYGAVATMKVGDSTFGANLSRVIYNKGNNAAGSDILNNIGVHAAMKVGPINLNAEVDMQMGTDKSGAIAQDYAGTQIVLQGTMALDPVAINFTVAQGSGNKEDLSGLLPPGDIDQIQTTLDKDPHYTFLYEYKIATAAGATNTGFANTTALGAGVDMKFGSVSVGASAWLLAATEDVIVDNGLLPASLENDLGMEIDARVGWKINDNVSWNIVAGYFMPGDAYRLVDAVTNLPKDADEATGIHSVVSLKF